MADFNVRLQPALRLEHLPAVLFDALEGSCRRVHHDVSLHVRSKSVLAVQRLPAPVAREASLRQVRHRDVRPQVAQRREILLANFALEVVRIGVEVQVVDEC